MFDGVVVAFKVDAVARVAVYGVVFDGVFVGFVSDIVVQGGFKDAEGVYKRGEEIYI